MNIIQFFKIYPETLLLSIILLVVIIIGCITVHDIFNWKAIEFDMEPEPYETVPESSNNEN